ncbi:MAG: hypothetical protein V2B20_14430 [Pseudomonadota bacterium]
MADSAPVKGQLEKLAIKSYTSSDYSGSPVAEFAVPINPEEIQRVLEIEYDEGQGRGTTGSAMNFVRVKPQDYTLQFTIDGTGVTGEQIDVQTRIREFLDIVGYDGTIHRPRYLQIIWGVIESKCVLLKAEINYKLFKSDGTPLRAVINATFRGNIDDRTRVRRQNDSSPDLTHVRMVREGDRLPLMTWSIYGDPAYYLAVARANDLDGFRTLKAGANIIFPPMKKV